MALRCAFPRGKVSVAVAFENQVPAINTAQFQAAVARRAELEAAYGRPLEFEDLDRRKSCRIADYRNGDVDRTESGTTTAISPR
jgi:hypothetical protein